MRDFLHKVLCCVLTLALAGVFMLTPVEVSSYARRVQLCSYDYSLARADGCPSLSRLLYPRDSEIASSSSSTSSLVAFSYASDIDDGLSVASSDSISLSDLYDLLKAMGSDLADLVDSSSSSYSVTAYKFSGSYSPYTHGISGDFYSVTLSMLEHLSESIAEGLGYLFVRLYSLQQNLSWLSPNLLNSTGVGYGTEWHVSQFSSNSLYLRMYPNYSSSCTYSIYYLAYYPSRGTVLAYTSSASISDFDSYVSISVPCRYGSDEDVIYLSFLVGGYEYNDIP